jgi:hypothetical protein
MDSCRFKTWSVIVASAATALLSLSEKLDATPRAEEFDVSVADLKYDPTERVAAFEFKISGARS